MRSRLQSTLYAIPVVAALALAPLGASAQVVNPFSGVPITGSNPDGSTFTGTVNVVGFRSQGAQILATGVISGTLTDATGLVRQITGVVATFPVTLTGGSSCTILHLELGPIDLNLLGIRIQTNRIVIDITAQRGTLLGDILCALVEPGLATNDTVTLLNRLLALLAV